MEPVTLKVMTFNIEYGGTLVDFDQVRAAVEASGADIVGINEPQDHTAKLAKALGWPDYSTRLSLVSKYQLIDPPGADGDYLFAEVTPGHVVAVSNVHLPSGPYSPRKILDGMTKSEAMAAEEQVRMPVIRTTLQPLAPLVDAGIPTFLIGDFNTPSNLDWTKAAVGARPQVSFAFPWPVGIAVADAGFTDSYRQAHPDPVTDTGLTWPSGRPRLTDSWNPRRDAPQDRIDFVYAAGPVKTLDSEVVGERGSDIAVDPWPSDHRAVVSTFGVKPGVPPTMVAVRSRLVTTGEPLEVVFHAASEAADRVVVVPAGGAPQADGLEDVETGGATDGRLTLGTDALEPGSYEAVLTDGRGADLSRSPFWVQARGGAPLITTDTGTYHAGDPIEVRWGDAPGNRFDWVAIYRRGADPAVAPYLDWAYTGSTVAGSATFDASSDGRWPLKPGPYSVYLLPDDDYVKLASTDIVVKP